MTRKVTTADEHRLDIGLLVLLAVTVLVASLPAVLRLSGEGARFYGLIAAVAVHVVMGTFVWGRIEPRPRLHVPFLVLQTALALIVLWLARCYGMVTIILIPLAAQGGILLERRGAVLFALVLTIAGTLPLVLLGASIDGRLLLQMLGAGTGIFFGVLFAQVVRGAWRSRDEAARKSAELATAEERNRLAREIHDSVGHALTTLHVQLEAATQMVDVDTDRTRDLIEKARGVAGQGLEDVRRAVAAMRSDAALVPLDAAIGELADKARQTGLSVELAVVGTPRGVSPETHLTVYRAAQEALTNVRKHGSDGRARMELRFSADAVQLRVSNPAAVDAAVPGGGFGLVGLRERAERLRGRLAAAVSGDEFVFDLEIPAAVAT